MFFMTTIIPTSASQMRLVLFGASDRNIKVEMVVPIGGDLNGLLTVGIVFGRDSLLTVAGDLGCPGAL